VPPLVVATDITDSAGDVAPDLSIRELDGAAELPLIVEGRGGGRILFFRGGATAAGRGSPAMQVALSALVNRCCCVGRVRLGILSRKEPRRVMYVVKCARKLGSGCAI
jgi:hypothetical protein